MPRATTAGASIDLVTRRPDQTAADTLEARWLDLVRLAGSAAPGGYTYLGGDVTDVYAAADGSLVWVGADWFAGTTVEADDTYAGTALPVRNGAAEADADGTFTGQLFASGASGVWLDAVGDGGLTAGTHWWPIAAFLDGATERVLCWHVDPTGGPYGLLLDSHLVALDGSRGYASHVATGLGALTDAFWLDGVVREATYTYLYGEQFVPDYDADTDDDGSVPNYGQGSGDVGRHYTLKRVARAATGTVTTVAGWEYWNGTAWVADPVDAAPMVDANGYELHGDTGIKRLGEGSYLAAAHSLIEQHVRVYTATAPQGPWTLIARVPVPRQGETYNGGLQIGQLAKLVPDAVKPAGTPSGTEVVLLSRNLLEPTGDFADRSILGYAPQFVVVPATAQAADQGAWEQWGNIARQAAAEAEAEAARGPVACPNDGEPLRRGADGALFCPWDGWRPT